MPANEITSRVLGKVQPGSIVLFHNAALNTPAALPAIIEGLLAQEYSFVPISEIIYKENFTINHEGRQIPSTTPAPAATPTPEPAPAATPAPATTPAATPAPAK